MKTFKQKILNQLRNKRKHTSTFIEDEICTCKKKSRHQTDSGVCIKCGKPFIL